MVPSWHRDDVGGDVLTGPPCVHLHPLAGRYAVCRMAPTAQLSLPADPGEFYAVTRTPDEVSVVCPENAVPSAATAEMGWSGLAVAGPLDFALTGILSAIVGPLAAAGIPIFAVSTYDTDYVFMKAELFDDAVSVLRSAGHTVG
ncbi:ACT domain-containing protein [Mycolicibacterium moriokaense]|nr:ACT domain-containing protein [Mycolicibacterium moriokaense]